MVPTAGAQSSQAWHLCGLWTHREQGRGLGPYPAAGEAAVERAAVSGTASNASGGRTADVEAAVGSSLDDGEHLVPVGDEDPRAVIATLLAHVAVVEDMVVAHNELVAAHGATQKAFDMFRQDSMGVIVQLRASVHALNSRIQRLERKPTAPHTTSNRAQRRAKG